jgi:hypothetical protein
MSALNNSLLLGQEGGGGYAISRSLRFNSSDSAYLSRTPASAGNRKTWTWSAWIKRNKLGTIQQFLTCSTSGYSTWSILGFNANDTLSVWFQAGSNPNLQSTAVYRDCSAWMHVLINCDTTQATAANRGAIYVNGVKVTTFNFETYPSQNADTDFNTTYAHDIGRQSTGAYYCDFMLADVHWIDGQALDPTSFGEFSATTGVWMPKAYTGTYGTNGFKLNFSDNSTTAALGTDTSGNGNTWTVNNLNVLSSYTDTFLSRLPSGASWTNPTYAFDGTTANYADGTASNGTVSTIRFNKPLTGVTLLEYFYDGTSTYGYNSTDVGTGPNLTGGSWVTVYSGTAITVNNVRCTSQPGNGVVRLYAIRVNGTILNNWTEADPPGNDSLVDVPTNGSEVDTGLGGQVRGNYCTLNPLGTAGATPSDGNLSISSSSTVGNRISTFLLTSGKWYWEANGTGYVGAIIGRDGAQFTGSVSATGSRSIGYWPVDGVAYWDGGSSGTGTTYTSTDIIGVALDMDAGNVKFYKNNTLIHNLTFGSGTIPNLSSGVFPGYNVGASTTSASFNFGQRPFAYTAPSGFKALCTANLPAPVVTKPSTVMDVKLWTGNGSTKTISGLSFSPDFVWIKERDTARNHVLYDTIRGATKALLSSTTDSEQTYSTTLTAFNSDGFSLDSDDKVNGNNGTYVGWAWDAGSSTVTNTQGSISSQVRANASAGFSIVTYTGNGSSAQTVGHGLGVAPSLVIVKKRSATDGWLTYFTGFSSNEYLYLNSTAAKASYSGTWGSTPTSTVFGVGDAVVNANGATFVAYCWSPVAGYSSFGSYTGASAPNFIYTGFTPALVIMKRTDTGGEGWLMTTWKTQGYNSFGAYLGAHSSSAEATTTNYMDIVSNGFVHRHNAGWNNTSGGTYIYAAFAESCFALNNRAR